MGRFKKAEAMLARYGSALVQSPATSIAKEEGTAGISRNDAVSTRPSLRPLFELIVALTLAALAWGLVNFGVLLWLPGSLMGDGPRRGPLLPSSYRCHVGLIRGKPLGLVRATTQLRWGLIEWC